MIVILVWSAISVTGFFCHNIEAPSLEMLSFCFVVFGSQRTYTFRLLVNALGTLATFVYINQDTLWSLNRRLETQTNV